MSQQLIDIQLALQDLLTGATYLAGKIGSSDGQAEAMKELIPHYLAKNEVDLAADLADTIEDPFVRDLLLVKIAEKCAELNDDEYALQLVEAIDDQSFQKVALEQIASQKALNQQFDKALEIADDLEHASNAYLEIAIRQEKAEALQTIRKIEFPYTKVLALQGIARNVEDLSLLAQATEIAKEIEFEEERIRAYLGISFQYIEATRNDKAIEVLDKARQFTETLASSHRDSFLSQISQGFMKAGSLDLADRTLDLVKDKYEIALTVVGYAEEFHSNGEENEALEALTEAYAILKSLRESETRNSRAKFNLLGIIAVRFAGFEKPEKAIEIAIENPFDEIRNNSLAQIAVVCQTQENVEMVKQAINSIDDEAEKTFAIIGLSDVSRKRDQTAEALTELNDAYFHLGAVPQLSMKSLIFNRLSERFQMLNQSETARKLCSENLQTISQILDESHRVSALADLAATFEELKFELNDQDKNILQTLMLKSNR